jgi:hypothetical protein
MITGTRLFRKRAALVAAATLLAGAVPIAAQSDSLAMLRGLAAGEWTVNYRDGSPETKICVKTGEELIQIKHTQTGCNRFIVEDDPDKVTVQYTCPGDGYGRTNIRRENRALVQIQSRGFASGVPFQFAAEARRTGPC